MSGSKADPPLPRAIKNAREPALVQGLTLIALAWVSTAAAVVLGPVLPQMSDSFKAVPNVTLKISLVATGPSLLVAVMAIPFGIWADRMGRRALLLVALGAYGVIGIAPVWLSKLDWIVISRIALGVTEAAIMTIGTALIGDYFHDRARERWLAAQTGAAPLVAVFLSLIGGFLGGYGWRTPFYVYAFGLLLVPAVLIFIWEPRRSTDRQVPNRTADLAEFNWAKPLWAAALVTASMVMFMVTVVQFGFLVSERGLLQPKLIGLWSAVITLFTPIGSAIYGLTTARTTTKLMTAYGLWTIGFGVISLLPGVPAVVIGGCIANVGSGFFLPTAINWLLSTLPTALVGRGSGLWTTAVFAGQFLGPLTILALRQAAGGLSRAIFCCAVLCGVAAVGASMARRRSTV